MKKESSLAETAQAQKETAGFAGRLRRFGPPCLILLICLGVFLYLLLTANRNVPFYAGGREEGEYRTEQGTIRVTVERAEVVNISKDTVEPNPYSPDRRASGTQVLLVRLKSGSHAGQTVPLSNPHFVGMYTGEKVSEGDRISVLQAVNVDTGEIVDLNMKNYDRSGLIWLVLGLFLLVVIAVGGLTGLKSLLGLVFTVITLIWIFIPLWIKGARPAPLAFGLCVLVAVASFVILGGTSRKILCAILGTVAGMGLAAAFSALAQSILRVDSYAMYDAGSDFADLANFQQRGFGVHLEGLLTAGIIISSLGAVMDVAMSLSSAISELKTVNPALGWRALWKSGMRIGRDMVGTMTNTLILAFVGSSLVLVIRLWMQGSSYLSLTSSRYLSVELISALSASIGVILAVPLTALISAVLNGRKKQAA